MAEIRFDIIDKNTIDRLTTKDVDLLPKNINVPKAEQWNKKQIQRQITEGITKGEAIPKIAKRFETVIGMTTKQSLRNARTAITNAENAGRLDRMNEAKAMGIKVQKEWIATNDSRTRDSHASINGEIVDIDKRFSNDCDAPGDYSADPSEVYNCRCTLGYVLPNLEDDISSIEETTESMQEYEFIPATTIKEAEEYAKKYVDDSHWAGTGVSYQGISIESSNEINKTLTVFYESYDVPKISGVYVAKGNTKLGKAIDGANMAYSPVRKSLLINNTACKDLKTIEKSVKDERKIIKEYAENPSAYKFKRKVAEDTAKASIKSGRGTVPETINEMIHHELGHSIENIVTASAEWETIKSGMSNYAESISGYATINESEYIAESFTSYLKGEKVIDPLLKRVFDRLKKNAR